MNRAELKIELLSSATHGSGRCRICGAAIKWTTTRGHSKMPLQANAEVKYDDCGKPYVYAMETHWSHCRKGSKPQ